MIANYQGEVGQDVIGILAGPDLHGALYEATTVTYDADSDTSTVNWKPISPNDPRDMARDEFGIWRVSDV